MTATFAALALTFASTGCGGHVKVPRVPDKVARVPDELHDLNQSDLNQIRKHRSVDKYTHTCYDDQGVPSDCGDGD